MGGYKPPNNAGCVIAFLLGIPALFFALILMMFEAGRCEGRGPTCPASQSPTVLLFPGIIIGSFALAWALSAFINRPRR
jgi:hypothetical protein